MKQYIRTLMFSTATIGLVAGPAGAQMYPGQDVTVNPAAIPGHLLYPGQPYPGTNLRPPTHHRVRHHTAPPAPGTDQTASAAPNADANPPPPVETPSTPAMKSDRHHQTAAAQTPSAPTANPVPFTFGEEEPPPTSPPTKVANAQPPQSGAPAKGGSQDALAKRGAILFAHSATDPQPSQLNGIKLLAGDLNSAIEAGATRIQLQAFGGAPGDKSSDARRISLKRALAIRQLLIDNGVPAARIDVRAMGGATDNGEPDRVDVYVRAS